MNKIKTNLGNWSKLFLLIALISLISAGCQKVVLKKEVPSSPKESYEQLPK